MGIFNSLVGKAFAPAAEASYDAALQRALGNGPSGADPATTRLVAALDVLDACIMLTDASNTVVSVNKSLVQMMRRAQPEVRSVLPDFDADRLVGRHMDSFHPHGAAAKRSAIDGLRGTYKARVRLGSRIMDIIANPVFGADGQRLGTTVEWSDVTEQVALEEEKARLEQAQAQSLQESSKVKSALDQLDAGMMIVDNGNHIEYCNSALLSLFSRLEGEFRAEVPGFSAANVLGSSLDSLCRDTSVYASGRAQLQFGSRIFQLRFSPLHDEMGQRSGMVIEWKDKTDELEFEASIIRTVEDAINGDLNSRISGSASNDNIASMANRINQLLEVFHNVIHETGDVLSGLSAGKLTRRITSDFRGVFGKLKGDVNSTIDNLVNVVNEIRECAASVQGGASEISSGNMNLSQRTEQQAASLEETSAAMEQITSTVQQNAANAVQANTLARGARESAENGGEVVNNAVAAMQAISESSNRINDIIGVIDEIAFQTNLLALNAAVEAARAGDQGRGFAVVADEVRNLAGRSATAAKEIKELIKDSGEKVREGSRLVNKSGETLHEIVTAVKRVNDIVAEISTASDEQATGLDEINRAVGEMDDMTQQNAALVEEAAAASEALGEQARTLERLITFFDLGHGAAAAVTHARPAAAPAARKPALPAAKPRKPLPKPAAKLAPKPAPKPVSRAPVDEDDKNWAEF